MTPKRILFYCGGSAVAGVEILTLALMEGLQSRGHAVHCLVSGWNDGDFIARLEAAGIGFDALKLGFLYLRKPFWTLDTILHYPGAVVAHQRLVKRFRPDVQWHVSHRSVLMLAPFLDSRRTLLHVHDRDHPSRRIRLLYRILNGKVVRCVAVSRFIRDHLGALGVPSAKIRVILNGVPADGADGDAQDPPRRQQGPLRIGIVGQIIERKGHEDLLEALRLLKEQGRESRCLVFGKGDTGFEARLRRKAMECGLDSIEWKGFVAERREIYSELDLVATPTRDQEPFGLAALEPAFWGLPVVASRSGGLAEIVVDGETGLLFEPGNPRDLADKLEKLLANASLRRSLGERARQRALERFSLDRMVGDVERLLNQDF